MRDTLRRAGVLLHLSSLPSPFGVGDLGPGAYRFVEFLAQAGMGLWQILPFCPTEGGRGNSPYSASSAFAGNPLFISPELLREMGLLTPEELAAVPSFSEDRVDYDGVFRWKARCLDAAFARARRSPQIAGEVRQFLHGQRTWLQDYALFSALKKHFDGLPWVAWPEALRDRDAVALEAKRQELAWDVEREIFLQYIFFRQWGSLRAFCSAKGVHILGDVPIFVDHDSADVWSHRDLFLLESDGSPSAVAGVPPDYFSPTGQRWGNPLYHWDNLRKTSFQWWEDRLVHALCWCDELRIDHFRGFSACWSIPAQDATAERGEWRPVPGEELFQHLKRRLGKLPFIAEDLGVITDDVRALMARFHLPGMKVLQFAFGGGFPENPYLPHHHVPDSVIYTGTHDNNTTAGWFREEASKEVRDLLAEYLRYPVTDRTVHEAFLHMAFSSVARTAIVPAQDIFGLGSEARMNTPSVPLGNWAWRLPIEFLRREGAQRLRRALFLGGRLAKVPYGGGERLDSVKR